MKTFLTKLSSSLLFVFLPCSLWAKPVAHVVDVSGTVFVVNTDGKTSGLKANQHIEDKSEILVEEGGSITLNDYFDGTYHLTGGSHLKFFNKSVQLKKGKTWIQASNARHPLVLTTANSHVDFVKGEFITTFDQLTSRTQVLVVNGDIEVSNILDRNLKSSVSAGSFTVVDPEVENGTPRIPTKIGLQSLDSALSEFKKLPKPMLEKASAGRTVASVQEPSSAAATLPAVTAQKGEIIFIKTERKPASVDALVAKKYFAKVVRKRMKSSPVPIRIFGLSSPQTTSGEAAPRRPASVPQPIVATPKMASHPLHQDSHFHESLKKHEEEQPKHAKELQNLIDELRSY
jgi:hypothetical protein